MAGHFTKVDPTTGTITAYGFCTVTDEPWELRGLDPAAYARWQAGELVQRAFPTLSPDDRELLISGTTVAGWTKLFELDEEENEQ